MFRPLSTRDRPDPRFDEPQAGLPDYLLQPAIDWMSQLLGLENSNAFTLNPRTPNTQVLRMLQIALRMRTPLNWHNGGYSAFESLVEQMIHDRELALDVLDFLVRHVASDSYADQLGGILTMGGSMWEVANIEDDKRWISRRVLGPVRSSIDDIRSHSDRAHHHLSAAWGKLFGRDPDPSAAFRDAIRAVEVVAKPVVTPNDSTATLGKIIAAIRDKPKRWQVVLDQASPERVADMAELIWKGQQDRHGTDIPDAPLNVSQEEADAAVHIAIPLVRLFACGGFRAR